MLGDRGGAGDDAAAAEPATRAVARRHPLSTYRKNYQPQPAAETHAQGGGGGGGGSGALIRPVRGPPKSQTSHNFPFTSSSPLPATDTLLTTYELDFIDPTQNSRAQQERVRLLLSSENPGPKPSPAAPPCKPRYHPAFHDLALEHYRRVMGAGASLPPAPPPHLRPAAVLGRREECAAQRPPLPAAVPSPAQRPGGGTATPPADAGPPAPLAKPADDSSGGSGGQLQRRRRSEARRCAELCRLRHQLAAGQKANPTNESSADCPLRPDFLDRRDALRPSADAGTAFPEAAAALPADAAPEADGAATAEAKPLAHRRRGKKQYYALAGGLGRQSPLGASKGGGLGIGGFLVGRPSSAPCDVTPAPLTRKEGMQFLLSQEYGLFKQMPEVFHNRSKNPLCAAYKPHAADLMKTNQRPMTPALCR